MKSQKKINSQILAELIGSIAKNKILEKNYSEDSLRKIIFSDLKKLNHQDRDNICSDSVQKINNILKAQNINLDKLKTNFSSSKTAKHLQELREDGITLLGEVLSPKEVSEVHNYLQDKPTFNGHVWDASNKQNFTLEDVKKDHPQSSYLLQDILSAPHLFEKMSDPNIINIAAQYLNIIPKLYSTNLMWSFGNHFDHKKGVARMFHHDIDNFDFCVLFIFLTDVKKGSGSHQFIRQSHKRKSVENLLKSLREKLDESDFIAASNYLNSDELGAGYVDNEILPIKKIEELFKDYMLEVTGKAGHAFLSDPYGLHRGVPVKDDDRLLFWGRYAIYDNGFSSSSSNQKLDWKNFEDKVEKNNINKYIFDSILAEDGQDNSLHSPDVKRLKENIYLGNELEVSRALRKNLGTKKYVKNFFASLRSKK